MAQSVQKSAGPLLLTGVVMTAGPAGWLVLGAAVAGLSVVQQRSSVRRLAAMKAMKATTGTGTGTGAAATTVPAEGGDIRTT